MLLAFFLGGFSNCFCFLTTRQMFEDEKERLHLFSVEDKKQKGKPRFFFFEASCLCRKSIYKNITWLQCRLKKDLKGFLETKFFRFFRPTLTLFITCLLELLFQGGLLWLDLRMDNSHYPAATNMSFLHGHHGAHSVYEVPWAERYCTFTSQCTAKQS